MSPCTASTGSAAAKDHPGHKPTAARSSPNRPTWMARPAVATRASQANNTDHGTVVLSEKTRFYTQDWESFKTFVVAQDAVDLLERRIHQGNMAKFLEENPALMPPGLNSDTEFDVSVRKPSTK